jgi:hypothetical protein
VEHRCGYRRAVEVAAIIRTRGGLVARATLCEVSASGGLLTVTLPVPIHSVVLVQFAASRHVPPGKGATVEAEVVRRTETGVAVEWVEFAPHAVRRLCMSQPAHPQAPRHVSARRGRP